MASLLNNRGGALMNTFTPPQRDYSLEYFTIESLEDGNVVSIRNKACTTKPKFYYSTDGGTTWSSITAVQGSTLSVATIDTGEKILFKCTQNALATGWDAYNGFQCSKNYIVYGNAMSLIYGDNFTSNSEFPSGYKYNLIALFRDDTHVIDASNLILSALTARRDCYNGMFRGCTNLRKAPKLPATTLADSCYSSMFEGCINLEEAPELPATTLANNCYQRMFCMDRNSRITTPKMTKSPVLPTSNLVSNAYNEMFKGNGNLVEITCFAGNNRGNVGCKDWVLNVSSTGIFIKKSGIEWNEGTNGVPSGWTVEDYQET